LQVEVVETKGLRALEIFDQTLVAVGTQVLQVLEILLVHVARDILAVEHGSIPRCDVRVELLAGSNETLESLFA